MDLALNIQQWFICHETKLNQSKPNIPNKNYLHTILFNP